MKLLDLQSKRIEKDIPKLLLLNLSKIRTNLHYIQGFLTFLSKASPKDHL